ncbi:MAG: xanthine phosphoribosyltransferase [Deinococcales bacterium]
MEALVQRILQEGRYLGNGILKVDSFINHQLNPELTLAMGQAFAAGFRGLGVSNVSKIVTAEVSGIAPALATGIALKAPVVYARKKKPITMGDNVYQSSAPSHTKGGIVSLSLSPQYLKSSDRVLLIDDFLASGQTIKALTDIIAQSGAELLGIGTIIEKSFEGGATLRSLNVPILSLAIIDSMDDSGIKVRSGL